MPQQRRRHLITKLLRAQRVASQEEIVAALAEAGEEATQATISRDLAVLGVLKGSGGYVLPDVSGAFGGVGVAANEDDGSERIASTVRRHATSVRQADSLVVIRTVPGHASLVGDVIDHWPPRGCVGTVAGDDTVFVATTGKSTASRVVSLLQAALDQEGL
jgi:transcriptional regulator of arginine metabolism